MMESHPTTRDGKTATQRYDPVVTWSRAGITDATHVRPWVRQEGLFDYESKVWAGHEVRLSPFYLGSLRLRYCLEDISGVAGMVLEIGCGGGGMAKAIKSYRSDLEVIGVDVSKSAIELAREDSRGVAFDVGNIFSLPYEDCAFGGVAIFDVLEHLTNVEEAVAEVHRVLREGGVFHAYVPLEGELLTLHGLLGRLGWNAKQRYGGHIQRLTYGELRQVLERQGFGVEHIRWSAHLFNQFVDLAYFTGLSILRRNPSTSVEGYLASSGLGILPAAIRILKHAVALGSFVESRLLAKVPSCGIHLRCVKKQITQFGAA